MPYKLRFFADFCLALTALQTLIRGSLELESINFSNIVNAASGIALISIDEHEENQVFVAPGADNEASENQIAKAFKVSRERYYHHAAIGNFTSCCGVCIESAISEGPKGRKAPRLFLTQRSCTRFLTIYCQRFTC